ncbi:MAG: hypothetical protein AAF512_20355, partial [Pseudomonadota bacterium]
MKFTAVLWLYCTLVLFSSAQAQGEPARKIELWQLKGLAAAFSDTIPEVRNHAMTRLAEFEDFSAIPDTELAAFYKVVDPVFVLGLDDELWEIRNIAIQALIQRTSLSIDILQQIVQRLEYAESNTRFSAVKVLSQRAALPPSVLHQIA